MAFQRQTLPLHLHITAVSILLVLLAVAVRRWLGGDVAELSVFLPLLAVAIVLALFLAHRIARPLARLAEEADAVRRFDFSDHPLIRSSVREVDRLAHSVDLMRDTVRRFLELNLALAGENDFERLLPRLLKEMTIAADASAGVLYLASIPGDALAPGAMRIGEQDTPRPPLPELPLAAVPRLLAEAIAARQATSGRFDTQDLRRIGINEALAGFDTLAVPLFNRGEQLVGALLLFSEGALEPARQSFVAALSASAALTLETRELVHGQKELFKALIRMIAGAIDAQSPYTGGHCERVPELTRMLARAACDATEGPYASFALDDDQWEAVHIASWLHDCGKVTTPEYVVDKATKLETVWDRIHEVRMRFEVLKRDAEIAYWRGMAGGADEAGLRAVRDAEFSRLDDDFAFVARCNVGGEYLPPEQQERLRTIGARRWRRTLDDRLGLSRDELARRPSGGEALPVDEPLLADKPEHRIARPPEQAVAPDNPWGFRMDMPELLYDRGELHNLTVSRGTLSAEERYKINEHIVETIKMLSQLPFPRHLRSVPEIAGGHHEKMDGTGYPKGLTGAEMSPVARMMAIADVFEALTAADRPYKEPKTVSQSLGIMARMVREAHLDAELFELFLRSGVAHEYAGRYLRPEQVDGFAVEQLLAATRAPTPD